MDRPVSFSVFRLFSFFRLSASAGPSAFYPMKFPVDSQFIFPSRPGAGGYRLRMTG
jgi:hypothetical protein